MNFSAIVNGHYTNPKLPFGHSIRSVKSKQTKSKTEEQSTIKAL